jgi:hypothetical protein
MSEQPRKMITIFITAVLVMVAMIAAWTLWTLLAPMLPG